MTLKEIEEIPREYLYASEIAKCLDIDPQYIRDKIRRAMVRHEKMPYEFPVIASGRAFKFPKAAFIKYMRGES